MVAYLFVNVYMSGEKDSFVEELVYRFLLTRENSLGGAMQNIAGKLAERKLT